jgi:predicted DNA-binding protein (MmcQ/YjbR family)
MESRREILCVDVTPAYHMNKLHWNAVTIGGDMPIQELALLIEKRYDLVKPKVRKQR